MSSQSPGAGGGKGRERLSENTVSFGGDDNVLELDEGEGSTTFWTY